MFGGIPGPRYFEAGKTKLLHIWMALRKRLGNLKNRGVVLRDGQTLKDLYEERVVLYEKYADITIDEENKNLEETLQSIIDTL